MKVKYLPRDYNQKLHGCLVTYKNRVYMCRVDEDNHEILTLSLLGGKPQLKISACDDDLDIHSVSLGFFNHSGKYAMYVKRIPYRQTRQGVTTNNVTVEGLTDDGLIPTNNTNLIDKGAQDGFDGRYPNLSEVQSMFSDPEYRSIAMSIDVAITRKGVVYYRGQRAGVYDFSKNEIHVPNAAFSQMMSKFLSSYSWSVV